MHPSVASFIFYFGLIWLRQRDNLKSNSKRLILNSLQAYLIYHHDHILIVYTSNKTVILLSS